MTTTTRRGDGDGTLVVGRVTHPVEPFGATAGGVGGWDVSAVAATSPTTSIWRLCWRVSQHEPRSFWIGWFAFVVFFAMPAANGFVLGRGFDALNDGDTSAVYRFAVVLAVIEALRMAVIHFAAIMWTKAWVHMQTILRGNLLVGQMASGGPEAGQPVGSAGEALTHFRDDAEDVAQLIDGIVDVSGGLMFSAVAGVILGLADARAAAVLVIPLVGVVLVTRAVDSKVKEYRAADREATGAVTGLVGDMMAAATTVKVNGASGHMLARLKTLVDRRGVTAVRDRVLSESVFAFSQGAADVGFGLIFIVSAGAIASGSLTVGTLALFAAYVGWLSFLPRMIGRVLARRKQAGVAFDRMRMLVADEHVDNTVRSRRPAARALAARRPSGRDPAGSSPAGTARRCRALGALSRRHRRRPALVRRAPGDVHGRHGSGRVREVDPAPGDARPRLAVRGQR